jgi:hypothetical protein
MDNNSDMSVYSSESEDRCDSDEEFAINIRLLTKDEYHAALEFTRLRLVEIAEDTILDPTQLQRCLRLIDSTESEFLALFDFRFDRRQRTSNKIEGEYLPTTLKREIEELLRMEPIWISPERSANERNPAVIDSEDKLLLLCLYLLWTSDSILEVSSGEALGLSKLQSLQYTENLEEERFDVEDFDTDEETSSYPGKQQDCTSRQHWHITYRSIVSNRRFILDLGLLHGNDLVFPSAFLDHQVLDKALIRATPHIMDWLFAQDDRHRFASAAHGQDSIVIQRRSSSNKKSSKHKNAHDRSNSLTVHGLAGYSLEQAQLVAVRNFGSVVPCRKTTTTTSSAVNNRTCSSSSSLGSYSLDLLEPFSFDSQDEDGQDQYIEEVHDRYYTRGKRVSCKSGSTDIPHTSSTNSSSGRGIIGILDQPEMSSLSLSLSLSGSRSFRIQHSQDQTQTQMSTSTTSKELRPVSVPAPTTTSSSISLSAMIMGAGQNQKVRNVDCVSFMFIHVSNSSAASSESGSHKTKHKGKKKEREKSALPMFEINILTDESEDFIRDN